MNRKVLIIGGSSDIGVELAKLFLKKNYNLDLHYSSKLSSIKNLKFKNINFIKADFSKMNDKNILKKFSNNYDIIINLTGFIDNKNFEKFKLKDLQKSIKINSIIPLMIIRLSIKNMIKKKWGRIINSSSIGVKYGGGLNTFTYSISKHINEFIPTYIKKLASKNVFYNVIRIGLTDTKIHKKIKNRNLSSRINLVPVKKMAKPIDIAQYIYFISSENNNFISSEIVTIAGGE